MRLEVLIFLLIAFMMNVSCIEIDVQITLVCTSK